MAPADKEGAAPAISNRVQLPQGSRQDRFGMARKCMIGVVIAGHAHHATPVVWQETAIAHMSILREAHLHAKAVTLLIAKGRSFREVGKRIVDKLVHKADHYRMID